MDIKKEPGYRRQPRGSKENSISVDYPDSAKKFPEKLRDVNTPNNVFWAKGKTQIKAASSKIK